jgi:hypothetical protein
MWCAKAFRLPGGGLRLATLGMATAGTLFLGSGRNRVVLDIDARSFMQANQTNGSYAAPSLLPVSFRMPAVPVNLIQGFKSFGKAEEVSLDLAVRFDNQTGDGQGHFKLYFGADSSSAYDSPPAATIDAALTPGTVSTGTAHLDADQRLRDLFTNKQMVMGVDFTWEPATISGLQGTYDISRIDAHVVSTMDLFQ